MLGVGFGIAVIIGNTIGAGIFRAPGSIASQLPDPWLFLGVWILGGLYALLGAISLAELGAMLPKSGDNMFLRATRSVNTPDSLSAGATGSPLVVLLPPFRF